jgi:hypothetical protein
MDECLCCLLTPSIGDRRWRTLHIRPDSKLANLPSGVLCNHPQIERLPRVHYSGGRHIATSVAPLQSSSLPHSLHSVVTAVEKSLSCHRQATEAIPHLPYTSRDCPMLQLSPSVHPFLRKASLSFSCTLHVKHSRTASILSDRR